VSRFVEHARVLDHLIADLTSPSGSSLIQRDPLRAGVALVESSELSEIVPYLRTAPPEGVTPKLRHVLRGPALPIEETQNSNQARNFMFELVLWSKLLRAGLAPELSEHPDLRCHVDNMELLVECKRTLSERGIVACVKRATAQLERQMSCGPDRYGGIAVSVSRVFNEGDKVLAFRDEARASDEIGEELEALARRIETLAAAVVSERIVGAIVHMMTPARQRDSGLIVRVEEMILVPFPRGRGAGLRGFYALGEALRLVADYR
jgi:hypothetical protein